MLDLKIGSLVSIYMKSGKIYEGALREDAIDKIVIVSATGRTYIIKDINNIECYSFISDENNNIIHEKNIEDKTPQHIVDDIHSLLELRKMKANEDIAEIRRKLTSQEISTQGVEYAKPISAIRAFKKRSKK